MAASPNHNQFPRIFRVHPPDHHGFHGQNHHKHDDSAPESRNYRANIQYFNRLSLVKFQF